MFATKKMRLTKFSPPNTIYFTSKLFCFWYCISKYLIKKFIFNNLIIWKYYHIPLNWAGMLDSLHEVYGNVFILPFTCNIHNIAWYYLYTQYTLQSYLDFLSSSFSQYQWDITYNNMMMMFYFSIYCYERRKKLKLRKRDSNTCNKHKIPHTLDIITTWVVYHHQTLFYYLLHLHVSCTPLHLSFTPNQEPKDHVHINHFVLPIVKDLHA